MVKSGSGTNPSSSLCASLYNTRLDTPQAMRVRYLALRGTHLHVKMPRTSNKMLKKSASSVLASFRPSTYPRGYALGPSLAAALLDELFQHLVGTIPHSDDRLSSSQAPVRAMKFSIPTWLPRSHFNT